MATKILKRGGYISEKIFSSIEIAKVPLCAFVGLSSLFGSVYASKALEPYSVLTAFLVFLLACGGASINSYQERNLDSMMARTRHRPLVAGRIPIAHALWQGLFLIVGSLLAILFVAGHRAFWASVLAIALYNFVYTVLKARTLYAIIPGAVCGALPPYIGWLATGGEMFSHRASLPVVLLFFWQIPHYFLVILHHREDYLSDVLPNLLRKLSETALKRIFLSWIAALATTMITFSVVPNSGPAALKGLVVINSIALVAVFFFQFQMSDRPNYRVLFRYINAAIAWHMVVVTVAMLLTA